MAAERDELPDFSATTCMQDDSVEEKAERPCLRVMKVSINGALCALRRARKRNNVARSVLLRKEISRYPMKIHHFPRERDL